MNLRTEVVLIVAGTLIVAGGVALELCGKSAPPELWVAGTGAIAGALGLSMPTSVQSGAQELAAALTGEFERLEGYLGAKAPAASPAPQPASEVSASIAKESGPVAASTAAPAPVTVRVGNPA